MEHRADAVAETREQTRQHRDQFRGQLAFAQSARTKIDGTGQVEQKPGGDFAVFLKLAHVGHLQPCRDVPVDIAHVIVRLVLAQVGQIEPEAAKQCPIISLQFAVEPAQHRPLEPAQQPLRVEPRMRRLRRRPARWRRAQASGERRSGGLRSRRQPNMGFERRVGHRDRLQSTHDQCVGCLTVGQCFIAEHQSVSQARLAPDRRRPPATHKLRARRNASARAPSIRLIVARGLAPNVM
jgi:hypothetical protein